MCILLFIISLFSVKGNESVEQIAFNHFASEILSVNYTNANKVYFSGQSEAEESIAGPFSDCFESNSFGEFYFKHEKVESERIPIDFASFKKSIKTKARNLNLRIYRSVKKEDMSYVYIKVFKEKHFVDHYLIQISSNRKVIDVCRVNEII